MLITQTPLSTHSYTEKLKHIYSEFEAGFTQLEELGPAVTIFGSARFKDDHPDYAIAYNIAKQLSNQGYHILSGGGPGIMEAANKGAQEGRSQSIGLNIELPHEQTGNPYQDISINFQYFFARKHMLIEYSEAFIFMPGGFGTLDEISEVLTLVQTQKISKKPCIFVNTQFWKPLLDWFTHTLIPYHTISPDDIFLYHLVDTCEEAMNFFQKN